LHVGYATRVVPDTEIRDVVVERITGEVAAPDVAINVAINVVTQESAAVILDAVVIDFSMVLIVDFIRSSGRSESRHFNDFIAEVHMRQPESPCRSAGSFERRGELPQEAHWSRRRNPSGSYPTGGHELHHPRGMPETGLFQPVEHFERRRRNVGAQNVVLGPGKYRGAGCFG
jgi:hypothetical protein